MSRAEEYYIYQQLEPNDILVTGTKQKREPPQQPLPQIKQYTAEEAMRIEQEYLLSKGIEFIIT